MSLGRGLPSHIIPFLAKKTKATFLSENGVQGLGGPPKKSEIDPDLINTSVETATITPGAAFFKISDSFNIIRGGHVDITFMGGLQVSGRGDVANWMHPGNFLIGMGGDMCRSAGKNKLVVCMTHVTSDGKPKILPDCTYPLTGR